MSGVETAGLMLGVLPLIIEGLKAYSNGVSTIKGYMKYRIPLQDLYDQLDNERVMFQNVCDELLDGLVENNKDKAALLNDLGGDAWKDPTLEEKLELRLSGASYQIYRRRMDDMNQAVAKIEDLFQLRPDHQVGAP